MERDTSKLDTLIDSMSGTGGYESDLAKISWCLLGDRYRYTGNNTWMKHDPSDPVNSWKKDPKYEEFSRNVSLEVSQAILKRALYWQTLHDSIQGNLSQQEENDKHDIAARSCRLLECLSKLRHPPFMKLLVREAREWFNTAS